MKSIYSTSLLIIGGVLLVTASHGGEPSQLADPTRPDTFAGANWEEPDAETPAETLPDTSNWRVSLVLALSDGKREAVLNQRRVRAGEEYQGVTVAAVEPNGITIQRGTLQRFIPRFTCLPPEFDPDGKRILRTITCGTRPATLDVTASEPQPPDSNP